MALLSTIIRGVYASRQREIDYFCLHPHEVQERQLRRLTAACARTSFGKDHAATQINSIEQFQNRIPIADYDTLRPWIDRQRAGENAVIWPTHVHWYAKSSGTTETRSKFIPVSQESLHEAHLRGPKDVVGLFLNACPDSRALEGRTLTLGGSHVLDALGGGAQSGDLSSILIENVPFWAAWHRAPQKKTALLPDFEAKVNAICRECSRQNITAFAGSPSWNLVMLRRVLEYTGKSDISQVWPNLELFMHGGMGFDPYREHYQSIIPNPRMRYIETYNASEGFFAIQNQQSERDMLLMLDYATFYEFLPVRDLDSPQKAVPLSEVKTGVNYALIITTNSGLWRYMIGDTVEFTSTSPYKIRITGRTKHFINVFGEEIIIENADDALAHACVATGAAITDYTAGPIYMTEHSHGGHQWVVEFERAPSNLTRFTLERDNALRAVNSDYDAKRTNNTTLNAPIVNVVPTGTFYRWMQSRGKLGGQNKVPRLSNSRTYIESLLTVARSLNH